MCEELVKELQDELNQTLGSTERSTFLSGILQESAKQLIELNKKQLHKLLNQQERLEEQFDKILISVAQNHNLLLSSNKQVRVKMIQDSFEKVKARLKMKGFYPFVEIGKLTVRKNKDPELKWPEEQS